MQEVQQINQLQILDALAALHQPRQERHERQPDAQHRQRNNAVQRAIEVHQARQLLLVVLRRRAVHAENHRRADAQFRQIQHSQHIAEEAVHAEIFLRQVVDEHHASAEGKQHVQQLPHQPDDHIDDGVFLSHPCSSGAD